MTRTKMFSLFTAVFMVFGISAVANAEASDQDTVNYMAIKFVKYSTHTTPAALEWGEAHTTGKAAEEPYRFGAPHSKSSIAFDNQSFAGSIGFPSTTKSDYYMKLGIVYSKIVGNKATVVVSRKIYDTRKGDKTEWDFLHKINFEKISDDWKISDYYTLLEQTLVNGKATDVPITWANTPLEFLVGNPVGYDSKGTSFPEN